MSEQQIIPAGAPTPFLTNTSSGLGGRMNGAFALLRQPAIARAMPAIALVSVLGLSAAAWLALQSPAQAPLYAGLAENDKAAVAEALQASGIGYSLDPGSGALSVDADTNDEQAHRARGIILALRAGLDFESGGGLALTLDGLYDALSSEFEERLAEPDPQRFAELRAGILSLTSAWKAIIEP